MTTGLLIFCCWTISFLFAGIEAGLLSIDPVRLRSRSKRNERAARRLERLLKHPERLLVTVLLVTNMADIVGLLLLTRFLVVRYGYAGFFGAIAIALPIYLFILGVLPKSLFRRFPFRALAGFAGLLEITTVLLWPVLELGGGLGRLLAPRRATNQVRLFAAREELKQITAQSEREGSLTSAERAMIHNVVDFRSVTAGDVMTPMAQSIAVQAETPWRDTLALSTKANVDRLPVIDPEGRGIGLINVLDILLDKEEPRALRNYMRRLVTARESEPAYRLLLRLRAARRGLAGVIDAQQKLIGVVTSEDLIKRLIASAPARST
ncbi:MAG: magnesium and cobalt exporter, family [Verrucomicrobiota bacterium]|jgi:CBS domain containing-hemolysin-like protein